MRIKVIGYLPEVEADELDHDHPSGLTDDAYGHYQDRLSEMLEDVRFEQE